MVKVQSKECLVKCIVIAFVIFFFNVESLEGVDITTIESAVDKGAVCLDGSPPAYQLDRGFGDGVNNWLVHIQGGGWCDSVEDCVKRKTTSDGLGSSKLMPVLGFYGILSNKYEVNPYFYNWNRVFMRYCDGASFTGDVEEVDLDNNLYFRGARIFKVIVEELMSKGMNNAQNAILSGCSAGGLASILNCDKFRGYFPGSTRVKCVADGGYFAHAKDVSGGYHFEETYDKVVTLHGSANALPSGCTSQMKASLCFYPQFAMPYINAPIFLLNSAYDTWQVRYIFATYQADPNGEYTKCTTSLDQCSSTQLQRLEDFRSDFLGAISAGGKSSSKGMFINTCYTHCQAETESAWFGSTKLEDKTIADGVADWFYDKYLFQEIDTENVLPHYC
uniref:pectin acetylesterase 8-like n=1 Tax=Erigeron canadensis TaxID=72917 RepID=UPI001CB9786D|nr:pectin acetylesterase 8-like [Erigeron canadensis]